MSKIKDKPFRRLNNITKKVKNSVKINHQLSPPRRVVGGSPFKGRGAFVVRTKYVKVNKSQL